MGATQGPFPPVPSFTGDGLLGSGFYWNGPHDVVTHIAGRDPNIQFLGIPAAAWMPFGTFSASAAGVMRNEGGSSWANSFGDWFITSYNDFILRQNPFKLTLTQREQYDLYVEWAWGMHDWYGDWGDRHDLTRLNSTTFVVPRLSRNPTAELQKEVARLKAVIQNLLSGTSSVDLEAGTLLGSLVTESLNVSRTEPTHPSAGESLGGTGDGWIAAPDSALLRTAILKLRTDGFLDANFVPNGKAGYEDTLTAFEASWSNSGLLELGNELRAWLADNEAAGNPTVGNYSSSVASILSSELGNEVLKPFPVPTGTAASANPAPPAQDSMVWLAVPAILLLWLLWRKRT